LAFWQVLVGEIFLGKNCFLEC